MPIIKSAKKKLRGDKKRESLNKKLASILSSSIKKAKKQPTEKNIIDAISSVDKSAKKNIIHKNKAARLKSKLSKLLIKRQIKPKTVKKNVTPKQKK